MPKKAKSPQEAGGRARMAAMSDAQKTRLARRAVQARWSRTAVERAQKLMARAAKMMKEGAKR